MLHGAEAKRRAFVRYRRADDQLNALVFEDLLYSLGALRTRKSALEARDPFLIDIVKAGQLRACLQHDLDLSVDMPVLKADGGEANAHLLSLSYSNISIH